MKTRITVWLAALFTLLIGRAPAAGPVNCNCVENLPSLIVSNCPAVFPDLCSLATNCFSTNVVIGGPNYCIQVPPPGSPASAGTNLIMFTVTDSQNNQITCPVPFIVIQPPNPTLTLIGNSNKTVQCGSGWQFDAPVIVSTCCDSSEQLTVLSTQTNGVCPPVITRIWEVTNICGLTATSTQSVTVVDSFPPQTLCNGVNFVPNGNLEGYTNCPSSSSQFDMAAPWFTPTAATSDYYNTCSGVGSYAGVPTNAVGVQTPVSGNGYGGIFTWSAFGNHPTNSYREYMEVPLLWPLVAGQTYSVSFYVSRAERYGNAMAEIGAHFSVGPVTSNNAYAGVLPVVPQVMNAPTNLLLSTNSWMLISGTFVAAGGEDHLTIGNFLSDPASTAVPAPGEFVNYSYYYVDEVSVQLICPPNVTNSAPCGQPLVFSAPTFYDQCSGTNLTVLVDTITNGACPKLVSRTWTAIDLCGNSNSWSQTFSLADTVPPIPICNGPNLIPNPGFDSLMTCPTNFSQADIPYPWNRASDATPDYFNVCGTSTNIGVPTNYFGIQAPFNGTGYAGGYCYSSNGETNPLACYREYLQVPLNAPLTAGQTYPVSFRVSLGDFSGHAIADIGAHFSVGSISNGIVGVLNAVPQVLNPATNILNSTNGWMLVSGFYTATGGETHLTLGCFVTDAAAMAAPIPVNATNLANPQNDIAYYFFDDVYVGAPCGIAPLVLVPCGTPVTFPSLSAWDACAGANLTTSITTLTNTLCPLSVTRTWTFTDLCGNSTNVSQTISNFVDNAPPLVLCGAANLVANAGFESYTNCPTDLSQLAFASPWYQPTFATPDWFNPCATTNMVGVPVNFQGAQAPFEGQSYAGLVAYSLNNDYREYLQAPLNSPLAAGQTYLLSFRVSLTEASGWAAAELGAHFSAGPVTNYAIQSPLPVMPQVENPSGNPLTSTNGWMLVQGTYTATGTETHITIGNFRVDNATTVVPAGGPETSVAYYYIDAVQLQPVCAVPTNVVVPCGTPIVFPDLTGYDLCSGTNVSTIIVNVTNSQCPLNITRTWTFTDACGNSTNVSQTMGALADTAPPIPQCVGTNLAPNPSFESYTNCPSDYSQLDYAVPWYPPNQATPDFFNLCNPFGNVGIPTNSLGTQTPFVGQGYAGAYVRGAGSDYREYLQAPLLAPLVTGQNYTVSFRVSLAESSGCAISQIGAHFSVGPVTGGGSAPLNVVPQVANAVTNIITETNGWILIQGTYTAAGGENYITLGNFLNDNSTPFIDVGGDLPGWSYYYFDDVKVISPCTVSPEVIVPCGSPIPFPTVTAYDLCSGTNLTTVISTVTNSTCPLNLTRTWTFTDQCGNSTNLSQQIFVTDNQPPVVNCACLLSNAQPLLFTNACHGVIPDFAFLTNSGCVTDNCGPIQIFQSPAAGTVVNPGSHPISLTVFDCNGNSTNCTLTYNVLSPPVAIFTPPDIFALTCSNSAVVNYNLNYFGLFGVITCTPSSGSAFPLGTNIVTCIGTTSCGDPFTNTFKVIVRSARVTKWSCLTFVIGIPYSVTNRSGGGLSSARMVVLPDLPGGGHAANFENFATSGQDGPRFDLGAAEKFTFSTELDFNAASGAGFDLAVPPGDGETNGTTLLRFRREGGTTPAWHVTRPVSNPESPLALYRSIAIGTNGELFSSFTSTAAELDTNVLLHLAPMNSATSVVMTVTLDCRSRELMLDFPFCDWMPDAGRKGWDGCIYGNGPRGGNRTNKTARLILTPLTTVPPAPITNLDLIVTNLPAVPFDNPSLNAMGRKWSDGHVTLMKAYDDGTETGLDFTSLGQGGGVRAELGHAAAVAFRTGYFQTGDVPTQEQFYNLIDSRLFTNSIRFTQTTGGIECAADFTQWGVADVTVQLWNGTTLVAETNHVPATLAGALVTLGGFPGIFSCSGSGALTLSDTNPLTVLSGLDCGGGGCVGTELRIIPELSGAAVPPSAFTGLECLISDGMDLRLSQLQTTPACSPAPINATRDAAGLHLNWSGDGFRLQGAESIAGPWYDLGVSPPATLPANSSLRLFRLRCD